MKQILTLLLLFLSSVSVYGQKNFPDVKPLRVQQDATVSTGIQAPAAKDGKTLYCGVQLDLLRRSAGLATFNLSDPMNSLTILNNRALNWIDDADYDAPIAGAWAKGKYYAFIGKVYSFVTCRKYWGTFDLETGNFSKIADAQPTPTFSNDAMYADYSPVYSMAYDNKQEKMYALYYDVAGYTGGFLNCVLATVDLSSGVLTKVGEFDKIYYSIAIDHFGKMYGLTYKTDSDNNIVGTNLYRINDDNGNVDTDENGLIYEEALIGEVKSADGDSFAGGTLQDMDFDNDSWVIRWNRISSAGTYICELNPETAVYSNSQLIGSNATVVGIYAPYTPADSPSAPGHVHDLKATPAAQGANSVTLSWTNPTQSWDRHDVEAVTEVHIYRGEELIGIVTDGVEKGAQSSFTDDEAASGFSTYKVVPCRNEDEEGVSTSVQVFVGYDVPGAPENVTLSSADGYNSEITWEAPSVGKYNGWYDPTTLTYTITRNPDNKVVAKNIAENHFTDNTLTTTQSYSYTVQASNATGTGLSATSNELILGPAINPPYSVSFTDNQAASLWTPLDANADGDGWRFEDFWDAWISTNYGNTGDDWLFSPDFAFEKGHSYRVSFGLYKPYHSSGGKEFITFKYGQGASVEAMTGTMDEMVEIANYDTRYYSYTLTADVTGKYNLGLNARGEASNWGTYFTAFSINEVSSCDLAATAVSGPSSVNATAKNNYTVTVFNKGAVTAESYSVQLVDDDDNVLGETKVTEPLAPQKETTVKVAWTPAAELANSVVEVYGRVLFDGDGDASNDNTDEPLKVTVGAPGNSSWVDYTGQEGWADATNDNSLVPFGFSYKSTWSEVIYNAADMDLPNGDIAISKISYDYNFGSSVEAKIKTYIGATDKKSFSNVSDLIGQDALTLVSDSTFDMLRGTGTLTIHFTKPFVVKAGQNIVIAIDRPYESYNDADVFNNHFTSLDSTPLQTSLQFGHDSTKFDWTGSVNTYTSCWIPVTHFFVEECSTGIESVYCNAKSAEIYTLSGVRVNSAKDLHGTYIQRSNGQVKKVILK